MIFISALAFSELLLLLGSSYALLLIGFFLTLGLSTLLNTTLNIISEEFSEKNSLMLLNILFFLQGIGTSGSQILLSRFASSQQAWNIVLLTFALLLIPIALLISRVDFGKKEVKAEKNSAASDIPLDKPALVLITLALALYLIAEHGVTNYIMVYGTEYLNLDEGSIGSALALYSFGIMSGRLLLSPIVAKAGATRMLFMCLVVGAVSLFTVFGLSILPLLLLTGFAISIVYPTLVNLSTRFVPVSLTARATTMVVSIASLFDIAFNFIFGYALESFGYRIPMLTLGVFAGVSAIFMLPLIRKK